MLVEKGCRVWRDRDRRGKGRRGKGTMWVIVQVENVSTCGAEEADMNDFGVLLSSEEQQRGVIRHLHRSVGPLW